MRAITEWHLGGMFAGTPGDSFRLGDFSLLWGETGAFMRTIAKGLALRTPAGAPPIRARLDLLDDGRLLEDRGFSH